MVKAKEQSRARLKGAVRAPRAPARVMEGGRRR